MAAIRLSRPFGHFLPHASEQFPEVSSAFRSLRFHYLGERIQGVRRLLDRISQFRRQPVQIFRICFLRRGNEPISQSLRGAAPGALQHAGDLSVDLANLRVRRPNRGRPLRGVDAGLVHMRRS